MIDGLQVRLRSLPMLFVIGICSFLSHSEINANDSTKPPNVLLIVSDDLTACLGCYGNQVCQTPNLDRLASTGVRFNRAYCQYPVCGPSRASFMSGLHPNKTKMLGNSKKTGSFRVTNSDLIDHPSLGSFLRDQGYYSARVSKIYHMGIPGGIEFGEAGGDDPESWNRVFDLMAAERYSPGELELLSPLRKHYGSNFARVVVPDERQETQTDYMAATQAIAILENRVKAAPESPIFLAVGFVRPHVPLVAPQRLFEQYPEEKMVLPYVPENDLLDAPKPARQMENRGRYGMNEQQQRQAISAYYASVQFMDEQVGRLLEALERLNLREETIIVFTSDHGYNLGEHGCWQKLSLFEDSVRVPLIISVPGLKVTQGKASDRVVELVDLYPTIAELTGKGSAAPQNLHGESLSPLLVDPEAKWGKQAAYTVSYRGKGESIRTERFRYNYWGAEGEELYDHQNDPHEFTNLVGHPEYQSDLSKLRKMLEQKRNASKL